MLITLLACMGDPSGPVTPPPLTPPPDEPAPPAPATLGMGVSEVVTPPEILRPTDVQDRAAPALLDVWFEADRTTADGLKRLLEENGFTVLDGDGESWRVRAPEGQGWEGRLARLPEVREAREAIHLEPLPSGNFREGSARYGEALQSFHFKEGGPQQTVTGLKPPPPDPMFPRSAPPQLIRCLLPIREMMLDGISVGDGWERALVLEPRAWVMVLDNYGACGARGWLVMRGDAPIDTLTVGGPDGAGRVGPAQADDAIWWESAARWLQTARPAEDTSALAAFDLLRVAPDEVLAAALPGLASGPFQKRLYDAWFTRSPDAALKLAISSRSPALLARAAATSAEARAAILADPKAPSLALLAALAIWRPGPQDSPDLLERLRAHPDPAVRHLVWERLLEASMPGCLQRAAQIDSMAPEPLTALYRDCPQQPVRSPAFQAVAARDRAAAGALVAVTLQEPETLLTGIAAVRHANALERDDLLVQTVQRPGLDRDIRRAALETLIKTGRSAETAGLVTKYGEYLGYKAKADAAGGAPGTVTAGQ